MNVICILMDTLRRDHLGCYGNQWIETPNLDRFARDGALFENAYIGSYPCMPARQDLWTGRLNFLWRGWSPLEYDQDDMVSTLSRENKTTMLVTDHYHLWQHGSGNYHFSFNGMEIIRGQELDNWITNPDIEIKYPASRDKLNHKWDRYVRNTAHFEKEKDYFAAQVFQKSMDWVEQNKNLQDFFLMIDCFDPHEPFDPPSGYAEKYNPGYEGESVVWPRYGDADRLTPEELKQVHALYCGEVTYVDHWFGRFYDKLADLSLLENTMIIVTSDHGFLFGEHNWLGKHARILFQDIARTPLLIRGPQIQPGTAYRELVQMADLTPTILQTMGVKIPDLMHGKSLVPLWQENEQKEDDIRSRDSIVFGVFGGPIYCTDGEWLLVKKPVPGNFPLYWYTRSHYNNWNFGQQNLPEDSKARLEQWNGERFPTQYVDVHPGHAAPRLIRGPEELTADLPYPSDELYNIIEDHCQQKNLYSERTDVVDRLIQCIEKGLSQLHAPSEQWDRLGLRRIAHEV
ncbi:sulfatase [Paenibacillus filicis]|uniref:Sulfatase n=1 Tax=Paenibacillus gyeongsangnamensis TaxID=3388067 RepID=A0ABT4Q4D3_9BACL|nr:sulfatase [Paenibacillus filicis]MCZ8511736.1 sulfatase [Paenibacillus filicis]